MAHVSTTLKRKFLRAAHNGKTKKMVELLNTANNEHDYQYNKRIVGLPSMSLVFERKRLLRENRKISRCITKHNLINVVDHRMNRTALHWACEKGKINAAKVALANGSNINEVDNHGQTALHVTCKHCSVNRTFLHLLLLLLDEGAKLDMIDSNGYTPLMIAVVNGNIDIVKILLMYGANIYIETNIGYFRKTAIDLADDKKQEEILQLLLRYVYQNDEDIT